MSRNAVISALDRKGWKTQKQIAEDAGLSKFAAKQFLGTLVDERFVERSTDSEGRAIYRPTNRR